MINKEDIKVKRHAKFKKETLMGKNVEKTLLHGTSILNKLDIKWWLSAGTILGIYRDGDFIPHDTDIDIGVEGDHYNNKEKLNKLVSAFEDEGFTMVRTTYYKKHPIQIAFIDKQNIIFDIFFYYPVFDKMIAPCRVGSIVKPSSLFSTLGEIKFKGHTYYTPNNIEEYLIVRYGKNWNIPKTSKDPWYKDATHLSRNPNEL